MVLLAATRIALLALCLAAIPGMVNAQVRCSNDSHGNTICRDATGNIVSTTNRSGIYSDTTGTRGVVNRSDGTVTYSDGSRAALQPDGSLRFNNGMTCVRDAAAPNGVRCFR
jgi:hypothetical protein